MSASSNVTMRPRFKAFTRYDGETVIINLNTVQAILPAADGVELLLSGNSNIAVKLVTMQQLTALLDP